MSVRIPSEVLREIRQFYEDVLCPPQIAGKNAEPATLAVEVLDERRIQEQWAQFSKYSPWDEKHLEGKRILEIGSGFGVFIAWCRRRYRLEAYGIDPDRNYLHLARKVLRCYGIQDGVIVRGYGESLPFPDESFDLIYSTNVLEHVLQWEQVVQEALRVLRKGGYLQFVIPNFGSFWEGHYGIPWIPNMPRRWARLFVRLFGRDPDYTSELQFINQSDLEKLMSRRTEASVLNWGFELWRDRLVTGDFSKWGLLDRLTPFIRLIHRLGMVDLVVRLGKRLKWHTPIIMSVVKDDSSPDHP